MSIHNGTGARFVRAALQVNPFSYVEQHRESTDFEDESAYNAAMVAAVLENDIAVVALTDHHAVRTSESLKDALVEAGVSVFPGFEAHTKDGIHALVLFDPTTPIDEVDRCIGSCGITDAGSEGGTGKLDFEELCTEAGRWGAVTIAAHATNDKGLLKTLKGTARTTAWRSEDLTAVAIPGAIDKAPPEYKQILKNTDPSHRRDHGVAVVNARDVSDPTGFSKQGSWTWIKMSSPTIESLRQAFLDPDSRVRLASDDLPEAYNHINSISWEGGFLDQLSIDLSENLNVLVGGRGAGKSTVVESLRFALDIDPFSKDARESHKGFRSKVLRAGTKVTVRVQSALPKPCVYEISREVGSLPLVRNERGELVKVSPKDIFPGVQILGQHEIAELAKLPAELTRLIERHVGPDGNSAARERSLLVSLDANQSDLLTAVSDHGRLQHELDEIPLLEEKVKQFDELGLADRLQEQETLSRALIAVEDAQSDVSDAAADLAQFKRTLRRFDGASATDERVEALIPAAARVDPLLQRLRSDLTEACAAMEVMVESAGTDLAKIETAAAEEAEPVKARVNAVLRELQVERIDGSVFVEAQTNLDRLKKRSAGLVNSEEAVQRLNDAREELLVKLESLRSERFRNLDRAVKKLNRRLAPELRIAVVHQGDRSSLFDFLADQIGGRQDVVRRELNNSPALSLKDLANACRSGAAAIKETFGITGKQGEGLASLSAEALLKMELLDLQTTTNLELNVAPPSADPIWRQLDDLSTGQRATAVLLLLLLDGNAPLIIDQPEDDLDNSFISSSVVPRLRSEKSRRQFLLSSHNPNIPVLADAELIAVLAADGDADGEGHGRLREVGSIDTDAIRSVIEVLEGGRSAFETRRRKYGF
jgi:hypothetical protein